MGRGTSGQECEGHAGDKIAHSSGTNPNHANTDRHTGKGPASGNGNSSRLAERAAAAHTFQVLNFFILLCIQGRVYRIRRRSRHSFRCFWSQHRLTMDKSIETLEEGYAA